MFVLIPKLVDGLQVLPAYWLMDAVFKAEHLRQCQSGFCFEAGKDKCLLNIATDDAFIAMVTRICIKHIVRCKCIPQLAIAEGFKPLNHIVNIFKNHAHGSSVSEVDSSMQIWREPK